jgi:hypothetical protein
MKKRLIYWLAAIPLIFTACVEDEYAEGSRTPIQFTVNMAGDKGITRSNTVNDEWTDGDPVAVQMTSGGTSIVKKYKIVTGSPIKLVPDTDVEPFYWPNSSTTNVTVSAWYPYAATKPTADNTNTSITDQSTADKYEAANLMETAEVTRDFNTEAPTTPFHLTFAHKMAKLIIVPYHYKDANGSSTSQLIADEVAKTIAKAINLCSGDNAITAYRNNRQFEVLVAPQTIPAGTKFIRLSYRNDNTKSSTFEFSKAEDLTLVAGKTYTYNVNFNTAADSAFVVTFSSEPTYSFIYEPNTERQFAGGSVENFQTIATVTCNDKTLTYGTDYVIDEANSTLRATNAGTYNVTIKGTGQYRGTNTQPFTWTINKKQLTGSLSYETNVSKNVNDTPFTNPLTNPFGSIGTVTYTSSAPTKAAVDSNGQVTIHESGTVIITATIDDANYTFVGNSAHYTLIIN